MRFCSMCPIPSPCSARPAACCAQVGMSDSAARTGLGFSLRPTRMRSPERYPDAGDIVDYLAGQLDANSAETHATVLRGWGRAPRAMFAQAWVSAVGRD
jgi:hypothetical protein